MVAPDCFYFAVTRGYPLFSLFFSLFFLAFPSLFFWSGRKPGFMVKCRPLLERREIMDDEKELPDIPWLERILDETPPPDTDYIAMLEELEYK